MRIEGRFMVGMAGLLMALGAAALRCEAAVTVDRKPEVVQRRTFDPAHPPPGMPPLGPHEAAVTHSQYDCALKLAYDVTREQKDGGICIAALHVRDVFVTLQLTITIWLPRNAPSRLAAHEEGHRRIEQRVYQQAAGVARRLAGRVDGAQLTGRADDCAAAGQNAANSAATQFCHDYLDQIAGRAAKVNQEYDRLTAHGTRARPTPDEATRQAFTENNRQAATSRPTTRSNAATAPAPISDRSASEQ